MYIIAGLGNPTQQYDHTRHNIGFDTITYLADRYHLTMNTKKFQAICGTGVIEGQKQRSQRSEGKKSPAPSHACPRP